MDNYYNKEGVLRENLELDLALPGNVGFYYSLPRLDLSGKVSFIDQSGHPPW
jgi:hypothetical protein